LWNEKNQCTALYSQGCIAKTPEAPETPEDTLAPHSLATDRLQGKEASQAMFVGAGTEAGSVLTTDNYYLLGQNNGPVLIDSVQCAHW
jgi:hypothetical protein